MPTQTTTLKMIVTQKITLLIVLATLVLYVIAACNSINPTNQGSTESTQTPKEIVEETALNYMTEKYKPEQFELLWSEIQWWGTRVALSSNSFTNRTVYVNVKTDEKQGPTVTGENYILIKLEEPISELLSTYVKQIYGESKCFASFGLGTVTVDADGITGTETERQFMEKYKSVGLDIYTTKDRDTKTEDIKNLAKEFNKLGYTVSIQIYYLAQEEYDNVTEYEDITSFTVGNSKYYEHGWFSPDSLEGIENTQPKWSSETTPDAINLIK